MADGSEGLHILSHQGVGPSGGEEWLCHECGRDLVVRWEPDFEEVILVAGDRDVRHIGSRHGSVWIGSVRTSP